jgi:hypothetical protein
MKITCKEATQLVSRGLDRELGWWARARLRLHLAICDGCSNFKKQMDFLRRAMRGLGSNP